MIAGIDEAGRGPLAGPVVAACVVLSPDVAIPGLNDSKKLTKSKRAALYRLISRDAIAWSYATASASEIDKINILQATKLAMRRAFFALSVQPDLVLVDGRDTIDIPVNCEAVIKGDQKFEAIMAASIIAKHIRDLMMETLALRYPNYRFASHSGYPTKSHKNEIAIEGLTRYHRKTFCKAK
ncbi:MAG: ribonuclease HII [Pseudomonadota bacterium]|nr:ribonuclease HII [Pseudomonadota bacterium]